MLGRPLVARASPQDGVRPCLSAARSQDGFFKIVGGTEGKRLRPSRNIEKPFGQLDIAGLATRSGVASAAMPRE